MSLSKSIENPVTRKGVLDASIDDDEYFGYELKREQYASYDIHSQSGRTLSKHTPMVNIVISEQDRYNQNGETR